MIEKPCFVLPADVRDALLRYLVQRPYAEVSEGVQALLALQPIDASPSADMPTLGQNAP